MAIRTAASALTPREIVSPRASWLTRKHTAFLSFADLLDALGGFYPSLRTQSADRDDDRRELTELADAYDAAQAVRGDHRRALRS